MQSPDRVPSPGAEQVSRILTSLEQGWSAITNEIDWYGRKVHDLAYSRNIPEQVSIIVEAVLKALPLVAIFTLAPTWVSVIAGITVSIYKMTREDAHDDTERHFPCPLLINAVAISFFGDGLSNLVKGAIVLGFLELAVGVGAGLVRGGMLERLNNFLSQNAPQRPMSAPPEEHPIRH